MDAGCGHDLAVKTHASKIASKLRDADVPPQISTANSSTDRNKAVNLKVPELGEKIKQSYGLQDRPAVLSIGYHCRVLGYTFVWKGERPRTLTCLTSKML